VAMASGVRIGGTLSQARTFCSGLQLLEHQPTADFRALTALGRWMTKFTPLVAVGWAGEQEGPPVLLLDITGCERYFGGAEAIVRQVKAALERFGLPARIAVAPTPGAAWAFASAAEGGGALVHKRQDLPAALAGLPVDCLRLEPKAVAALHHLGLHQIGQVMQLPRDQLPSRFGQQLLLRLDQALGDRPEPLVPLPHETAVGAKMELEGTVESLETIWLILRQLLGVITTDLERRGRGARRLEVICTPSRPADGRVMRTIELSRPTRNPATLFNLLKCATENLEAPQDGFIAFEMKVPHHQPICDEQVPLFEAEQSGGRREFEDLVERLKVRMGADDNGFGVITPELVESHVPERAWRPATGDGAPATGQAPVTNRPLHLLDRPREILVVCEPSDDRTGLPRQFTDERRVCRLTGSIGPERIAGEWWQGHHHTRDYYEVEEESGVRSWIFRVMTAAPDGRVSVRWFLHGRFD
jgi:protein ImuB